MSAQHKGPDDLEATVHDLLVVLGRLNRQLRDDSAARTRELTWPQVMVLTRLDRFGPAGTTQLAHGEGMRPQSMGTIVAALEASGHCEGAKDPADARRTVISLTASGKDCLERERALRQQWLSAAVSSKLSPAEQSSLAACVELLTRLLDA